MYHFENFVLCEGVVIIRSEGPKHLYRRLGIDVDRGYPHGAQNDGVEQAQGVDFPDAEAALLSEGVDEEAVEDEEP